MTRLTDLTKGRREYLASQWPANPKLGRPEAMPLKIQALTDEDFQECVAAAYERFRSLKLETNAYTADDLESEISIQILARACRDPEQPDKVSFAVDADDLRRNSSPWERTEVGEIWKQWQDERNPTGLSQPERDRIAALVKKKEVTTLKACGVDSLASYLLTMASQPST
jgi:hypothetical protein